MAGYKFRNTKISFPIVDENDVEIKAYTIDIGEEAFLKNIQEKGEAISEKLKNADGKTISESIGNIKEYIDLVLGSGEFDFLYEKFGRNVFAAVELTRALTDTLNSSWKQRLSIHD